MIAKSSLLRPIMTCTAISEADSEIAGIGVSLCTMFACLASSELQ